MLLLETDSNDILQYRYNHYSSKSLLVAGPLAIGFILCVVVFLMRTTLLSNQPLLTQIIFSSTIFSALYYLIALYTPLFKYQTVLVIKNIGVQVSSSSIILPQSIRVNSRFVPLSNIQDFIITEAFKGLSIVFCLSILLKDYRYTERKLIMVFPDSDLKLQDYNSIRKNLRKFIDT